MSNPTERSIAWALTMDWNRCRPLITDSRQRAAGWLGAFILSLCAASAAVQGITDRDPLALASAVFFGVLVGVVLWSTLSSRRMTVNRIPTPPERSNPPPIDAYPSWRVLKLVGASILGSLLIVGVVLAAGLSLGWINAPEGQSVGMAILRIAAIYFVGCTLMAVTNAAATHMLRRHSRRPPTPPG